MDIFTRANTTPFAPINTIENWSSLIWTERYSSYGDFTLTTYDIETAYNAVNIGDLVGITTSQYLMVCEDKKITADDDGNLTLTITGRSAETVMEKRVARLAGASSDSNWTITDTKPIAASIELVTQVIVNGDIDANDVIPNFLFTSNITEPSGSEITLIVSDEDLATAVRDVLTTYGYGLLPYIEVISGVTYLLVQVIEGVDHTVGQTSNPVVIFDVSNGDLADPSYLFSNQTFYNVAYVYSPAGMREVLAAGLSTAPSGWDRRVLYVDASDIATTDDSGNPVDPTVIDAAMDQRGAEALADATATFVFDGTINENSISYVAGVDYYLGDHVTLVPEFGPLQTMQVTEIIRTQDNTGKHTYPTLVAI